MLPVCAERSEVTVSSRTLQQSSYNPMQSPEAVVEGQSLVLLSKLVSHNGCEYCSCLNELIGSQAFRILVRLGSQSVYSNQHQKYPHTDETKLVLFMAGYRQALFTPAITICPE